MSVFDKVDPELDFPAEETRTRAWWKERGIFDKSLEQRKGEGKGHFVFYEGPPTANGLPHNGHVLTRAVKDVFPRYKTMQGYDVPRKAGWDTHGLPVEVEVEKELRIHGKADIERYGVEKFTARCIESVFRYTTEWEHLTERVGFVRNNVDYYSGATFGCHENYLVRRGAPLNEANVQSLLAFLTLRVLYTGAGRVRASQGAEARGDIIRLMAESDFQISQRADYINNDLFEWVQFNRAIINARDEPLADHRKFRRLHLLIGDSNMSPFATALKIGTTSCVLSLVEEGLLGPEVEIRDPLEALRSVSRDPTWRWLVKRKSGGTIPAVDLQRIYLEAARKRRKKVTSVDKANVLESSELWRRVMIDVQKSYPDVEFEEMMIDSIAMKLVTDPQTFYRQDDVWTVPEAAAGSQSLPGEAYYVRVRLPGKEATEFALIQPLVPTSRPNMIAWVAARNDGENYGQVVSYRFPKDTSVFGPSQVGARIDDPLETTFVLRTALADVPGAIELLRLNYERPWLGALQGAYFSAAAVARRARQHPLKNS
mgnify:CR=1 FL=1